MSDPLADLEQEAECPCRERDAALVEVHRVVRAEAELRRRRASRLNHQNEPPFEVMLRSLALACTPRLSKAQLEIRDTNVWQNAIVHAPHVPEVQLNRLSFRREGKLL
jgi:hypothetical protein